jgi:hypothetical protein
MHMTLTLDRVSGSTSHMALDAISGGYIEVPAFQSRDIVLRGRWMSLKLEDQGVACVQAGDSDKAHVALDQGGGPWSCDCVGGATPVADTR